VRIAVDGGDVLGVSPDALQGAALPSALRAKRGLGSGKLVLTRMKPGATGAGGSAALQGAAQKS
jgi:hypothetical protein